MSEELKESEEAERISPILRKRDVIPPLCGAGALLVLDGYLLLPGLGMLLATLMILVNTLTMLVKLLRRRGGKVKVLLKISAYGLCLGGILLAHAMHRADARENAAPLIAAIEHYHLKNGTYPQTTKELVPDYLAELPRPTWRYNPGNYLLNINPEERIAVIWWPAHVRVMLTYDLITGEWRNEVLD